MNQEQVKQLKRMLKRWEKERGIDLASDICNFLIATIGLEEE